MEFNKLPVLMPAELVIITSRTAVLSNKLSAISAAGYRKMIGMSVSDPDITVQKPQRCMWTQGSCVPWRPQEISMVNVNYACSLIPSISDIWYTSGHDLYKCPFRTTTTGGSLSAQFTEQFPNSSQQSYQQVWSWGNTLARLMVTDNHLSYHYFNTNEIKTESENVDKIINTQYGTWLTTNMCPHYNHLISVGVGESFYTISAEGSARYLEITDRDSRYEVNLAPLNNFTPLKVYATANCISFLTKEECLTNANHVKWDIRQSRPIMLSMNSEKTKLDFEQIYTINWNIDEVPFYCNKNGITIFYDIRADAWLRGNIMAFPAAHTIESVCVINQAYTGEIFVDKN